MRRILGFVLLCLFFLLLAPTIQADEPALGIHLLDPNELSQALELAGGNEEHAGSVTVVLRVDDRDWEKWQKFFEVAAENHVMPLIRLATEMTEDGWRRPTKKDIVEHASFLTSLDWYSEELRVIAFNEPNHAAEWGGVVDAKDYANMLEFTINWFHTEPKKYIVLPAGLDAAVPNSSTSKDNIAFIKEMIASNLEILKNIDGWTSHAYPNPGFVGSPFDSGEKGIKSFAHELAFLKKFSDREFDVYITETGWKKTSNNAQKLADYYKHAVEKVWNEERIIAITPFVFVASEGPFKEFSFVDDQGLPTSQYLVWRLLKFIRQNPPSPLLRDIIRQV